MEGVQTEGSSERGLLLLEHRGQETLRGRVTLSVTSGKRPKLISDFTSSVTASAGANIKLLLLFFFFNLSIYSLLNYMNYWLGLSHAGKTIRPLGGSQWLQAGSLPELIYSVCKPNNPFKKDKNLM